MQKIKFSIFNFEQKCRNNIQSIGVRNYWALSPRFIFSYSQFPSRRLPSRTLLGFLYLGLPMLGNGLWLGGKLRLLERRQ